MGLTLSKDELRITTTLITKCKKLQMMQSTSQWKEVPQSMKDLQIGLISVEPGTGMIRAMIGGNSILLKPED